MPSKPSTAEKSIDWAGRRRQINYAVRHKLTPVVEPLMKPHILRHAKKLPSMPASMRRRYESPKRPWATQPPPLPDSLKTMPGTKRDPVKEEAAAAQAPLRNYVHVYKEVFEFIQYNFWRSFFAVAPRLLRARKVAKATRKAETTVPSESLREKDRAELTHELKSYAKEIGLSAVGVAPYNPVYTFAESPEHSQGAVIVCILEQNYEMTQRIPDPGAEQAALSTYAELLERSAKLSELLHERGFAAQSHDQEGEAIVIYYGEQAGLGQLGRNGQLLTRAAGSRCRISIITTDAPLVFDGPKDFGVQQICDECNVCAKRCPSGAIPTTRSEERGVEKSKLNTKRCMPVVAQADGCAICMKTCPVQAYGLDAVIEEYERSGEIIGKGTDALEGYTWIDGKRYGPGERPQLSREFMSPPGFPSFDTKDLLPMNQTSPISSDQERPAVM